MESINGGTIKPVGYTVNYVRFDRYSCTRHSDYSLFCHDCGYAEISVPVTLGGDILALIVDRDTGELVDWVGSDTYWETATTLAHSGEVIISQSAWDMEPKPRALVALMSEAALYSDCFGVA